MNNIYRVWCANKNEWEKNKTALLPNGTLIDLDHYNKPVRSDTHKVYHCIGKEDNNKKLIYEGDIVKRIDVFPISKLYGREDIGLVKYINGSFYLECNDDRYLICLDYSSLKNSVYIIIGNECENPELLEQYKLEPIKLNKEKKIDVLE